MKNQPLHTKKQTHGNMTRWLLALAIILAGQGILSAQTVSSLSALQIAINNAGPGAVITLTNGTYTASSDIVITKQGTATAPITIQAQTIGGATIGGTAGFSINSPARYIIIKGFRFTHSASQATMGSGTSFCRWTRNLFQTPGSGENLSINGNDHEVDFNTFQNKTAMGRFITVRGSGSQIAQRIRIHHNYFFNHDQQTANGAESLQFGLSGYSLSSSNSIVEHNLFDDCRGENEMISIKASAVTVRYNTIKNSTQLTLRHGNFCNAYGNYIVGSEGIRFFGDDHKIYNNHIESCSPGIQIGNGGEEVADGAPLTSHDRPDRCLVAFNTLVNNTSNIIMSGRTDGLGATFQTISNNIVQGGGAAASIDGPLPNATWSGNIIWQTSGAGDMPSSGYRNVNPLLARDATGSFHLQSGSPAINTATSSPSTVPNDMDGQPRTSPYDVGADEVSSAPVTVQMLTPSMVGQNGSTTPPTIPAAPTNLTATSISSSQINLSWTDNSNNESNFSIERSTNAGTTWSVLTTVGANTTTFSNTGLSANTTYHYRVRATNTAGNSAYSNIDNATTSGVPVQSVYQAESAEISQGVVESNHVGFNGTGFVNYDNVVGSYVEWDINVASAGTYNLAIRYANASGVDRPMSVTVNGTVTHSSLSFPATTAWTEYVTVAFTASLNAGLNTVRATSTTVGGGPNTDELQVNGLIVSAPAAPSGLTANAISTSQIDLSWTDNSTNEANFRIERSTDGGTTWSFLANAAVNATTFSNTGLTASTTYHYRVRAENTGGNSAFSNIANATTSLSAPAAPSGLTATTISTSQINLSWTDNSNNETSFRIERSTDAGATWSFLADAAANVTTFSSTGLTASTTYHYRVRAENAGGNSSFSNVANATTNPSTTLQNVALSKPVTASGSDTNLPAHAVDGDNLTRWSASPMPQWLEVDLGALFDISRTEIICYQDRAYQFTVEAKTTSTGAYTQVVNRSTNTTPGTIAAPITNTFSPVNARYVRINVTGASGYTGTWASIIEFRVFGVPVSTTPSDIFIEAESGTLTAPMQVQLGSTAFGGQYITVAAGNNSQTAAPATGRATYNFSVPSSGTYKVWGRVIAPTTSDDSFWVRMDGGTWINWNEIVLSTAWTWDELHNSANANTVVTFSLAAGSHTLDVAYREDGTQLDRILITNDLSLNPNVSSSSMEVSGGSPEALLTAANDEVSSAAVLEAYPIPANDEISIRYVVKKEGNVRLILHNAAINQAVTIINEHKAAGVYSTVVDLRPLPAGIHAIRLIQNGKVSVRKLIKR